MDRKQSSFVQYEAARAKIVKEVDRLIPSCGLQALDLAASVLLKCPPPSYELEANDLELDRVVGALSGFRRDRLGPVSGIRLAARAESAGQLGLALGSAR